MQDYWCASDGHDDVHMWIMSLLMIHRCHHHIITIGRWSLVVVQDDDQVCAKRLNEVLPNLNHLIIIDIWIIDSQMQGQYADSGVCKEVKLCFAEFEPTCNLDY